MTTLIFLIGLVELILVHELGHFLVAKWSGIRVDEFGLGFPPRIWGWKPKGGETTYSLNAIPFGGFVKIYGEDYETAQSEGDSARSFIYQPKWKQVLVLIAGVSFNILLAWLLFTIAFMNGVNYSPEGRYSERVVDPAIVVAHVLDDSPAHNAGIEVGDKILFAAVNETALQGDTLRVDTITDAISKSDGAELELLVTRDDDTFRIAMNPSSELVDGRFAVGLSMVYAGTLELPFHLAIIEAGRITIDMIVAIVVGISDLIAGIFQGGADLSSVVGPVGIAGLVGDAAGMGFISLISFMAIISLHLAVINLVPFPALDGGRILFVIIEKIKGSPINPKVANALNLVGFVLLILLLLVVTYRDIVRLF